MSNETDLEKFERYLRGKHPELSEEQIEQAAAQFSELALFSHSTIVEAAKSAIDARYRK